MFKKEEWVALAIFLLFVVLFVEFRNIGMVGVTGLAVANSSEPPSFDVVLTKTDLSSGENLEGFLNITFENPFDPATKVKVEFNDISKEIVLKDYFGSKNISFTETEPSIAILNPSDSKPVNFDAAGSKTFAFKLPKFATVNKFDMILTGSQETPASFVGIDVEEYTGKKEWKYFGNFLSFNTNYVYPASLTSGSEGDPVTIGGQEGQNKTYFCEAIGLPESKHFKLAAKLKKNFDGADVKAVLLSFDGEYAFGGADFCDIPEPAVGATSNWYSCDLSFTTAKQGTYLVCLYYEGDTGKNYYELSRDSTSSDSRFDCPIIEGDSLCFQSFSKDYFIGVKTAKYSGVMNASASWANGVTDQEMKFSLTRFLEDCEQDEIGDCVVPFMISSESAGTLQLSSLRIDYTEESGASSYSNKIYDTAQTPVSIIELGGVNLEDNSKILSINLAEFNLTVPSVTKGYKTLYLEAKLTPGDKVTKPVKVYSPGYNVPETGEVEDKVENAKALITEMQAKNGEELSIFGIQLDTNMLDSFLAEINVIKAGTNISVEGANDKLDALSKQVDSYLESQVKSFSLETSFKDLYISEPGDVEKVVVEDFENVYFFQSNIEVTSEVSNYALEKYNGVKEKYSIIEKTIIPQKSLSNVYIYEIIPKTVADNVLNILFKSKDYEVVQQDPIIRYAYTSLSQPVVITYGVKGATITSSMLSAIDSIVVPKKVEEVVEKEYKCGDGICTGPYEDKVICPQDCESKRPIPWVLIIILMVLLALGIFYINFYKGRGAFRKVVGKSPFANAKDLENVKDYIKNAQGKGKKNPEIAGALLKSGWTKDQIVYAFEDLKWDKKRLLTIKLTPHGKENVRKLQNFIKKCLELSIPKEKIRNVLLQKGWSAEKVDEAFAKVGEPQEKIETPKEKEKKTSYYFEKELEEEVKK